MLTDATAIGPFHWLNRKLSAREMCRIQTFPDDLEFDCGRTDVQRMLGNAVPSLIAEVLGRAIRQQLLGDGPDLGPLRLLPPSRKPIPPREPVMPVPAKYLHLVGEHPDHSGERKKRKVKDGAADGVAGSLSEAAE